MTAASLLVGLLLLASARADPLPGVLRLAEGLPLGLLESGVIAEVAVRPGQRVERGALLLRLDGREFEARVAAARARLADAKARDAEARRELERARELYERTLLSDHERQVAANAATSARARRDRARAELRLARLARERSRLLAPFSGVVTRLRAAPGMAVRNDFAVTPLLRLVDETALRVEMIVAERRLASLPPGRELNLLLGKRRLRGRVAARERMADAGASLYRVLIVPESLPDDARAGQPVRVEIE